MKKIKYIIGAMAFALCSVAFAQMSNTSNATEGLYRTDVDDYMSITNFTNVEPENIFAYTNFSAGTPSFGVAKKFGSVYTGLYFNGWFNRPYSTSKTTEGLGTTYTGTIKGSGNNVTEGAIDSALSTFGIDHDAFTLPDSSSSHTFNMGTFVGINNIGIRLNFSHNPGNSYTLKWTDGTDSLEYNSKHGSTTVGLSAGAKLDKETLVLTPWGALSWTGASNHTESIDQDSTGTLTTKSTGNSYSDILGRYMSGEYNLIAISAGFGMETKKEDLTHNLNATLTGNFFLYDKQRSSVTSTNPLVPSQETTQEDFAFRLRLNPSYKLQFDPEERFSIALAAYLPIVYRKISEGPEFEDNVQQDYESSAVDFYLSPSVDVAARWFAIPDKLTVNLGASAYFGNLLGYSYWSTAHEDAHNKWTFLDGDVSLSASTGLSFDFAKGITLDASYDIINGYTINGNTQQGTKLSDIWSNSMSFQLSVKL